MIRFALEVYSSSIGLYKRLRARFKGVFNLPSGSTCARYSVRSGTMSGLTSQAIEEMAERHLAGRPVSDLPERAWYGGLATDEMSIDRKSGLVFHRITGRLVGFTDLDVGSECQLLGGLLSEDQRPPETKVGDMLGTHVLEVRR